MSANTAVPLAKATLAGDELIDTPIGTIELVDTFCDDDASKRLFDEMDYQRAVQAYMWSMPLVSITTWRDTEAAAYGVQKETDFVVLESLKEKRGIVTANLTTPYIFNFISLGPGALEIRYPPGMTAGGVLDFWQRPVFDLGLTGPDQGKGGTYIVVGPEDDSAKYKRDGAIVYQSVTNNIFVGLRILDPDPNYFETFSQQYRMDGSGRRLKPAASLRARMSSGAPLRLADWTTGARFRTLSTRNRSAKSTRRGWR